MSSHKTTFNFNRTAAHPNELGANYDGDGVNFALFSEVATRIELCLFDEAGNEEIWRGDLPDMAGGIWYGYLPKARPGLVYGYRVHGPYDPEAGHRCNPSKLLLDPYARQTAGELVWDDALYGYPVGGSDLDFDQRDSAPFMPKAVVSDPEFDWEAEKALDTPWTKTFIYEAHIKGLTMRHPQINEAMRGTFAGLAEPAVIEHIRKLGVTAIELLPIHGFIQDRRLLELGLANYWGYNSISFFAPYRPYLKNGKISEVKRAIRNFHAAGIEVILDVVYNHTAEGNEMGPTLSFRGIDNRSYYLLSPDKPRHGFDTTGTGNTLNVSHPMVLRMVMDSLRYWVEVFHIDGFRFDLASTLAREDQDIGFHRNGAFFSAIRQDPILRRVKLIAEPWDIGEGGYQVGGFPWPFREWNDKFRDDVRAFWRRDSIGVSSLSERLLGSPRQFRHSNRPADSSINFLSAHDGFTLYDTVSYKEKCNEANGEDNRDGHSHNLSDNMGIEGPTEDKGVQDSRLRRRKAMLATLMASQGVPMMLAGDELGHTQNGNNNAYCQDNELTWLNWDNTEQALVNAVSEMVSLRRQLGFTTHRWLEGGENPNLQWWHPDGREMAESDWQDISLNALGLIGRLENSHWFIFINGGDDRNLILPEGKWNLLLDSSRSEIKLDEIVDKKLNVGWQSVIWLKHS